MKDCCDASDEYASGAGCENNCAALAEQATKHLLEEIAQIEKVETPRLFFCVCLLLCFCFSDSVVASLPLGRGSKTTNDRTR